jgi:hypothetical protein
VRTSDAACVLKLGLRAELVPSRFLVSRLAMLL